jgi:D-sedoheptulose 7-phosphate isomerase
LTGYIEAYFKDLQVALERVDCTDADGQKLTRDEAYARTLEIALAAAQAGSKQIFIGNGGSAAIASHMAIDFSKNGGLPAICFNDGAALTCLGNDFGYEEVFSRQIGFHARKGDVLFAISSSGTSKNILKAVEAAVAKGCRIVTLSGFSPANPLRTMGEVNFHIAVNQYGIVEVAHHALIHGVVELKRAAEESVPAQAAK